MAFFLIKHDGNVYANRDLFLTAFAGGEKALNIMIRNKEVTTYRLFDQLLFELDSREIKKCREYSPTEQDFEDFFKHINILSADTIDLIKKADSFLPNASLITIRDIIPNLYKYRQVNFFRVRDCVEGERYRMLAKTASVKVCSCVYVALNAVDVRIENPIVVTLKD